MSLAAHRIALFILAGSVLPGAACAQSFLQAMSQAWTASPDLRERRAAQFELNENVNQAQAGWRPTVSVSAGSGRNDSRARLQQGDAFNQQANPTSVRVSASQPVWNGSVGPRVDAAEARVRQGDATSLQVEQAVLLDAARAYVGVLQARELLRLNETNEATLAQQVTYRQELFRRALGTRTELAQAEARQATARAELARARNDLATSEREFARLIGAIPGELTLPTSLPPIPARLDALVELAERDAPAVRSARHALDAAGYDVEAARGAALPAVSVDASYSRVKEPSAAYRNQQDMSVQLTLSVPIYQGGGLQAATRASEQRGVQALAQLDRARLAARQNAVVAWNGLQSAQADAEAFAQAVAANEIAYEGMRAQFERLGELTLLDVLDMQRELFNTQVSLVRAQAQRVLSHLEVLAAQGELTARGLGLRPAG